MRLIPTILMACLAGPAFAQQPAAPPKAPPRPALTLTTTAFEDGGVIPNKYTGLDAHPGSPMLAWTNVPGEVATLVMIMHDTDVAAQKKADDNLHWMVFNIPASTAGLPEGVPPTANLPDGAVQAKHSRGAVGYMPPGAPPGPYHHYIFELYGLDTKLDVGPDATRADVLKAMDGHVVAKASLTGRFHR
jgi:Raf kinase inhibitor-like YbhB/YbcL family protein